MARTYRTLSLSLPPEVVDRLRDVGLRSARPGDGRLRTAARVAAEIVLRAVVDPSDDARERERLRGENERLWEENADLRRRPLRTFDQLGADRLADEVAVLVHRRVVDARSPVADALLDYRDPPSTPRAERMARLEADAARLERRVAELEARLGAGAELDASAGGGRHA